MSLALLIAGRSKYRFSRYRKEQKMENIYHDYWQQELMYQFLVDDKCKKKAYVCSPYSAEDNEGMLQNMRTARAYMFYALKKMGMCARAPHAFLPMLLCDNVPSERAIALKFGTLKPRIKRSRSHLTTYQGWTSFEKGSRC